MVGAGRLRTHPNKLKGIVFLESIKKCGALSYIGYGQGLTFYTHTADEYAQLGSWAITSTMRDATYVFDEVLDNEMELPLPEHTIDTHGYPDLMLVDGNFDAGVVRAQLLAKRTSFTHQHAAALAQEAIKRFDHVSLARFIAQVRVGRQHRPAIRRYGTSSGGGSR